MKAWNPIAGAAALMMPFLKGNQRAKQKQLQEMTTNPTTPFGIMESITGTHWATGDGPNDTIRSWLAEIASNYPEMKAYCHSASVEDYFEWCGLTVGYCMSMAGIKPIFGQTDLDQFLWANAWREWGEPIVAPQIPQQGDVVVFKWSSGQHHVTLFESDLGNGYWACRGGNQGNEVKVDNFPKKYASAVQRFSAGSTIVESDHKTPPFSKFVGGGAPLTQTALDQVCQKLGVGPAEIWALTFTETDSPFGGFYSDKRPQILFERHIFHRLTNGQFDDSYPDISNSTPGGYGPGGSHQYDRLSLAMGLDESAALQSASWGIGQVLGENYVSAGCTSPEVLVTQQFGSEDAQLLAVANEIIADGAAEAFAAHDWARFARIYNGPGYASNNYDEHLRSWYDKFSSALPDLKVRSAQLNLMYLGLHPGGIDGAWGKLTRLAMNDFQTAKGMPITEQLDDATFAAIEQDGAAVSGASLTPHSTW
jgi:N-acetylmuramidase/Putative peptidoglycan binding domain